MGKDSLVISWILSNIILEAVLLLLRLFNLDLCYRLQNWYTPGSQAFLKKYFWFELNLYLFLMVWLEIWCLAPTCVRDLKLGTHFEGVHTIIFCQKNFLVRLELVAVLNGLTWNLMFNLDLCYRLQTWCTPSRGPYKHLWEKNFGFDLNLYLELMVWLEIGCLT